MKRQQGKNRTLTQRVDDHWSATGPSHPTPRCPPAGDERLGTGRLCQTMESIFLIFYYLEL
jgi:hypothetical protein